MSYATSSDVKPTKPERADYGWVKRVTTRLFRYMWEHSNAYRTCGKYRQAIMRAQLLNYVRQTMAMNMPYPNYKSVPENERPGVQETMYRIGKRYIDDKEKCNWGSLGS